MRRKLVAVFVFILLGSLAVAMVKFSGVRSEVEARPVNNTSDSLLDRFSNYKKWTLVNPVPQLMEPLAALDCRFIPGRDERSPHLHKYISVYVNDIGRDAMMTQLAPKFPPGSLIVKEKLSTKESTEPELLTAMVKHEPGYNPEGGDWEYVLLNGTASEIQEHGKLARCQTCHTAYQKRSDFVTRTYLPRAVIAKLK